MTDLKFNILGFLYHAPNREQDEIEFYKQFGANKCVKDAIRELLKNNPPFIKKVIGKNSYALTDDGSRAYESEREIREQKASQESQNKKQYIFNKKSTIISIIIAVIMAIVTLIEFFFYLK